MVDRPELRRIIVVDAHAIVRHGLVRLVEDQPDLRIVGQASTAEEGARLVCRDRPDLVVLGLNLRGTDGLELVRKLADEGGTRNRVLVLSVYDETLFAERCLRYGAAGYVEKKADADVLIRAVRTVLSGELFVGEGVRERILRRLSDGGRGLHPSPVCALTDRELQVFRLLGVGRSTRKIAELLGLSVKTVETHRAKIMKRLGIENATQLLQRAVEWTHLQREASDAAP